MKNSLHAIRPIESPLTRSVRLGVLISGEGTTLKNLLEKIAEGQLDAEVALVIASQAGIGGLEHARRAGLPSRTMNRRDHSSVEDFSRSVFDALRSEQVDLVILAGFRWLLVIPPDFQYRVMNIHPALIPAFCGKGFWGRKVHQAALERGVTVSGCTVHFADNEYDHGPIILQKTVPVLPDDTPDTLAARVFQAECLAYPEAVRLFASGRLTIVGRRVLVKPVAGESS